MTLKNPTASFTKRLGVDVAIGGNFTAPYPAGESAATYALADPASYEIAVNANEVMRGTQLAVAFGPTLITVTNNSPLIWSAEHRVTVSFNRREVVIQPITQAAYDALAIKDPLTLYLIPSA